MPIPNDIDFTAFDTLTAAQMDDLIENDNALADGTAIDAGSITKAHLATGSGIIYQLGLNRNAGATLSTSYADFATVTATSLGSLVEAEIGFVIANANSGADRSFDIRVLCDGATITPASITGLWAPYSPGNSPKYTYSFNFSSTPAAGSHTWKLQMLASVGGAVVLSDNFIRVLEVA